MCGCMCWGAVGAAATVASLLLLGMGLLLLVMGIVRTGGPSKLTATGR